MQKIKYICPIWRVKEKFSNRWDEYSTIEDLSEKMRHYSGHYDENTVSKRMFVATRQGGEVQDIYTGDILLLISKPAGSFRFCFAVVADGNMYGMELLNTPFNANWFEFEDLDRKWDYYVIGNKWTTPELFCAIMTK
nr:MAG TPA: YopX protein [Caudoviricetes sp.]